MVVSFKKSMYRNLFDTGSVIGSAELEDGQKPCDLQDCKTSRESGHKAFPVNRFRLPVNAEVRKTNGTSGLNSIPSSASVALQSCLANNLAAKTDVNGSMEYRLTLKSWDTSSGRQICALRALGGRTSDSESIGVHSGWPTPRTVTGGAESSERKQQLGRTESGGSDLQAVALLAGWGTPSARDWKDTPGMSIDGVNPDGSTRERLDQLPRQIHGATGTQCSAEMERRGVLDAQFSRWLMAFPESWDRCSPNWKEWDWMQSVLQQCVSGQEVGWRRLAETVLADYEAMETR